MATADTATVLDTPFHRLGGHAALQAICERFYDLMESDPAYAELRAMHAADLAPMRAALPQFLAGWAGGPRDWFEANPGRCMMSLHRPYKITRELAGQWAEAMERAISGAATLDAALAKAMSKALCDLARRMAQDP